MHFEAQHERGAKNEFPTKVEQPFKKIDREKIRNIFKLGADRIREKDARWLDSERSEPTGGGGRSLIPLPLPPGALAIFLGGIKHFYDGPNLWTLKLSALSLPLKEHSLMQKKYFSVFW